MSTIHKMFEHVHWANQRVLETLQQAESVHAETIRLFAHILHSEQVWLTRLQGKDSSHLPIWSDANLIICEQLVVQNEQGYRSYLHATEDKDFNQLITYRNSKQQQFSKSIGDILTHVALHGQYHRGQINLRLRPEGVEPISLDYILFVD
ncbi:putative damage-inducible protein DinB [Paenibacillus shirakamiensis]|uniref:Damage-inducible protein DinB n=1 Tax=Paenibacillus shirakamiensis TaxID=1265935 RepID=A0ABS4JBM8_9BACL|nr:DinB family protein [Paenibacillus shirakamiensis]MBP1999080.1 putative damage-inducible protein DinB [Paenibacillus shirakamiensis]